MTQWLEWEEVPELVVCQVVPVLELVDREGHHQDQYR